MEDAKFERWRPGPLSRIVVATFGAVFVAFTAWFLSYPGGLPGDLWALGVAILLYLAWPVLVLAVVAGVALVAVPRSRSMLEQGDVRLVAFGILLLALGLAAWLGGALRVRLSLSDEALERRALAYRPDTRARVGRAGLYDVIAVQDGPARSVVLVTNRCGAGECGFAYSPAGPPPGVCGDSDYQVYTHVAGPWYVAELYPSGPCG